MTFAEHVKGSLLSLIREMASTPWLFSKKPDADFSRSRKLDFASTVQFILSMESGSLKKELLDYFQFSTETPSASAFSQQRSKLLSETFPFLFDEFNSLFPFQRNYNGYRLLACDGSDINIARNPEDTDTYFQSVPTIRVRQLKTPCVCSVQTTLTLSCSTGRLRITTPHGGNWRS